MIPEALAAQMFRMEVLQDRYAVQDGTHQWFERVNRRWEPVSIHTIKNEVNKFCMAKAMSGLPEAEEWEAYLYMTRQSAVYTLAHLSEHIRKPKDYFTDKIIPMDEFWEERLIPDSKKGVTRVGLFKTYLEFAALRDDPVVTQTQFRRQLKESKQYRFHKIQDTRIRVDMYPDKVIWKPGEDNTLFPNVYRGVIYRVDN